MSKCIKKWVGILFLGVVSFSSVYAETIVPSDYDNRGRISFTEYSGTETLTNFPIVLLLTDGTSVISASDFESDDYSDLRFTTSDGSNTVPYEVETWFASIPVIAAPTNIAGCTLWLKADAGVETNATGGVTNWVDQSGNGNDAHQEGTTNVPQYVENVLNGNPAVRYDGTLKMLRGSADLRAQTIFIVNKVDASAVALAGIFNEAVGKDKQNIRTDNGQWNTPGGAANGADFCDNGTVRVNGDDSSIHNSQPHILMETAAALRSFQYQLGQTFVSGVGRYFYGDVEEVIVYDRELTASQINSVNKYLGDKYSLTVSQLGGTAVVWVNVPELTADGINRDVCLLG